MVAVSELCVCNGESQRTENIRLPLRIVVLTQGPTVNSQTRWPRAGHADTCNTPGCDRTSPCSDLNHGVWTLEQRAVSRENSIRSVLSQRTLERCLNDSSHPTIQEAIRIGPFDILAGPSYTFGVTATNMLMEQHNTSITISKRAVNLVIKTLVVTVFAHLRLD